LVHPQLDCALLFPASKSRDIKNGVGPRQDFIKSSKPTVPIQARFWLEWGCSTAGQSLPVAL
jgi:hypothetical protein